MGTCPHAAGDLVQTLASQTVFPAPAYVPTALPLAPIVNLLPLAQLPSLASLTFKPLYCVPMPPGPQRSVEPTLQQAAMMLQQLVSPAAHPQVSPSGCPSNLHSVHAQNVSNLRCSCDFTSLLTASSRY